MQRRYHIPAVHPYPLATWKRWASHMSGIVRHFFCYLRQHQWLILIVKKAVATQFFGTGTGGNVVT